VGDQYLITPWITLAGDNFLAFWQRYGWESGYDGGVVEISTNGATWTDIGSQAITNGYDAIISTGYSSSIGGRSAFTGSRLTFRETRIPLTNYTGRAVKVRFRLASDSSIGGSGWWVDDVSVGAADAWMLVYQATTNVNWCWWTAPAFPGTSGVMRARQAATNPADSAWAQTAPVMVSGDADGDGLPDLWELRYFTNLTYASGTTDRDGDGCSEINEFMAGTVPTAADSVFQISTFNPGASKTQRVIRWASVSNRLYTLGRATNLWGAFTTIAVNITSTPPLNVFTDSPPAAHQILYRIATE